MDKLAERAFIIDPVADECCPEAFKDVVSELVGFVSDIHAKREHGITCSFPETHKCEVHYITFASKFVIYLKTISLNGRRWNLFMTR